MHGSFCLLEYYIVWLYYNLINHSPIDGFLGFPYLLILKNNDAAIRKFCI